MKSSSSSAALCFTALLVFLAQLHATNVCDSECVVEVYSANCGGANCVSGVAPGMEPFLCNTRCVSALGGEPMIGCLQSDPEFADRAVDLSMSLSADVEGFCIGIGRDPFLNAEASLVAPPFVGPSDDAASPPQSETPASLPPADVGPAVTMDEGSPVAMEEASVIAPASHAPTTDDDMAEESGIAPASAPTVASVEAPASEIDAPESEMEESAVAPASEEEIEASEPALDSEVAEEPEAPPSSAEEPEDEYFAPECGPAPEPEAVPSSVGAFDFDDMEEDMVALFLDGF